MAKSSLFRFSNGSVERLFELPDDTTSVVYSPSSSCWFSSRKSGGKIYKIDQSGTAEEWLDDPKLEDMFGFCGSRDFLFVATKDGYILRCDPQNGEMNHLIGRKAATSIFSKRRMSLSEHGNILSYDQKRDFLFIVFPKFRCIGVVDGASSFSIEFGSGAKEFSIGSSSEKCGFVDPVSVAATDNGMALVCDGGSHSIWVFKLGNGKSHKLLGVYGTPMRAGQADGELKVASFSSPQLLLENGNVVFLADNNGKTIREIDMEKMSVKTICDMPSQAICLATDSENNPCWVGSE